MKKRWYKNETPPCRLGQIIHTTHGNADRWELLRGTPLVVIKITEQRSTEYSFDVYYHEIKVVKYRASWKCFEEEDGVLLVSLDNGFMEGPEKIYASNLHEYCLQPFTKEDFHQWRGTGLGEEVGVI